MSGLELTQSGFKVLVSAHRRYLQRVSFVSFFLVFHFMTASFFCVQKVSTPRDILLQYWPAQNTEDVNEIALCVPVPPQCNSFSSPDGSSSFCLPSAGTYTLAPQGCYRMDRATYSYSTADPKPLNLKVLQYR